MHEYLIPLTVELGTSVIKIQPFTWIVTFLTVMLGFNKAVEPTESQGEYTLHRVMWIFGWALLLVAMIVYRLIVRIKKKLIIVSPMVHPLLGARRDLDPSYLHPEQDYNLWEPSYLINSEQVT